MATLPLDDDPRTKVWRLIRDRLRDDPILKPVIATWLVWDGDSRDSAPIADVEAPALRLTPELGTGTWADESGQQWPLIVEVEAYIASLDYEDALNLQGAIEDALVRDDPAFRDKLNIAGAVGTFLFDVPLSEKLKKLAGATGLAPVGSFRIDVRKTLFT